MQESYHIGKSLDLIEQKLGWGDRSEWTNSYFEILSDQIQEATGVYISGLTLKRLFGKIPTDRHKYNPQKSTKHALAKYLGYKNWGAFVQAHPEPVLPAAEPPEGEDTPGVFPGQAAPLPPLPLPPTARRKFLRRWAGAGAVALLTVALLSLVTYSGSRYPVRFEGKDLVGPAPLYSAFYYDVTQTPFNTFFIEGDKTSHSLPKDRHYYTEIFEVPNFQKVKLLADGKEVGSVNVHALSQGWVAVYQAADKFHLLPAHALQKDSGHLYIPPAEVAKTGLPVNQDYWIAYKNIKNFGVSGDSFALETCLKNNPAEGGVSCFDVLIEILGEHSRASVMFVQPSKYVKMEVGDVSLNGIFHQLHNFEKDFLDWRKVRLQVQDKVVQIYFEEKLVDQIAYTKDIGAIKGLILNFKGTGAVDYVRLYTSDQQLVYHEGFGD